MRKVWIALLTVVLAGCADGGGQAPVDEDDGLDLEATETTGVVRGIVLDRTITPIEGAKVVIKAAGLETVTNAEGVFGFERVEPGLAFIDVSKPGFEPVQQSVEVVAGIAAPPMVKVQLIEAPGTEPFPIYLQFEGRIGCAFKAANRVFPNQCAAIGDPDKTQVLNFGTTIVPHLLQTEIVWRSTQEFGRDLGTIQEVREEGGSGQRIGNVWGPSPLVCTVTRDSVCDNGDGTGGGGDGLNVTGFPGYFFASVYAACYQQCVPGTALGAGIVMDQSYNIYSSAFFNYRPPEGWTLERDGDYPPP